MWFSVVLPVLAAYGTDCSEETALKLVIVFDVSYSTGVEHRRRQVAVANSILERVRKEAKSLHWGVLVFATNYERLLEIEQYDQAPAGRFTSYSLENKVGGNSWLQGNLCPFSPGKRCGRTNYGPALTEAKRMLEGYPDAPLITGNVKRVKSQIIILTDGKPTDLGASFAMRHFRQTTFANTEISIGAALLTKPSLNLLNIFGSLLPGAPLSILKDLCCDQPLNCDGHVGHFTLTSATAGGDWAAKLFGNLVQKNICGEEPPIPASDVAPVTAVETTTTPAVTEETKVEADKETETSGLDIMQLVLGLLALAALFLCGILCLYCHKRKSAEEESMVADFKPAIGRPRERKPRVRVNATKR